MWYFISPVSNFLPQQLHPFTRQTAHLIYHGVSQWDQLKHTHTRTPACWPSSSLPHHVLSEKENGDDFICLYLRLSKLHDNFPVGHIVYLLWAEENRRMWAAEQLMALMNQSVCTQDAWWKPYISKAGVHRGVWFCNKMQALSVRWLMNAPKL